VHSISVRARISVRLSARANMHAYLVATARTCSLCNDQRKPYHRVAWIVSPHELAHYTW